MKIKDLPKNTNLGVLKIKTPDGTIGYWVSQWPKGVWIKKENDPEPGRVYPIFVEDLKECLEWEVMTSTNEKQEST